MLIYIILILAIGLCGLYPYSQRNSKQSRKIFLFLSFSMMTIILGFRGANVGEDTNHYLNIFKHAQYVKWSDMLHSTGMRTAYFTDQYGYTDTIENGFLVIAKIVHWFTDNGNVFLFVVAGITCFLFAKFIYDNCEKVVFPTIIFLCESTFMIAFNGVRQILAAAITVQAYTLLKEKKWKSAVIVILLASLIHNVSLICIALLPMALIKPKKEYQSFKYAILVAIASPFIVVFAQSIILRLFPRYTAYFSVNFWGNSLGGTTILWIAEFVLILIMYKKKFKVKDSFKTSCLILIYLACELMGLKITMFSRVGWFFRPYLMIFLPQCKYYFGKKTWRLVQGILIVMLIFLYFSYASTPARTYTFCW